MISFPNCKINLGLYITSRRQDGYHDLETIFYPVALNDALELIIDPSPQAGFSLTATGIGIDTDPADNICTKAYRLLKKDFPQLPAIQAHLHKQIPAGAGLGGGSADGAFTLKMLNDMCSLNLSSSTLMDYALQLGSDCPFFILNKPAAAVSRGEVLEEISLDLSGYVLVLINPGIHINTGWAFTQVVPSAPAKPLREIMQLPVSTWKEQLQNVFEKPVFEKYPEIEEIKKYLYQSGAAYASLSGSGSTLYGLFENQPDLSHLPSDNFVKVILPATS